MRSPPPSLASPLAQAAGQAGCPRCALVGPVPERLTALQVVLDAANVDASPIGQSLVPGPQNHEAILVDLDGFTEAALTGPARQRMLSELVRWGESQEACVAGLSLAPERLDLTELTLPVLDLRLGVGLVARVASEVRRTRLLAEMHLRWQSLSAFGLEPVQRAPKIASALYFGEPDPYFLALNEALGARGRTLRAALTPVSALDALFETPASALVLGSHREPEASHAVLKAVRRSPKLMHLPTLATAALGAEALGLTGLLGSAQDATSHAAWLVRLMETHEAQEAVGQSAAASCLAGVGDTATRLFGFRFAHHHLQRQCQRARETGRSVTLAAVRLERADTGDTLPPDVFADAANLVRQLVRGSDVCARLDWHTLLILFGHEPLSATRIAGQRIEDVFTTTRFLDTQGAPVDVSARLHGAALAPWMDANTLLRTALEPFAAMPAAA